MHHRTRRTVTPGALALLASLALLLSTGTARADLVDPSWESGPGLRWDDDGPDGGGAWEVRNDWSDPVSDEEGAPTYSEAYAEWVLEQADAWTDRDDVRRDCADFSISLVITYAAEHGLPVSFRIYFARFRQKEIVRASEARFHSPEHFDEWCRWHMGAMNLASNTFPVTYETWRAGDMVLMDWNRTDEPPNFGGREVWHTYLVGEPGETAYYGNLSGGEPTPITKLTSAGYIRGRLVEHPDRHGDSPRRWWFMRGVSGTPAEATGVVDVRTRLNVRSGPSTDDEVVGQLKPGMGVKVIGRDGDWLNVERDDGSDAWIYGPLVAMDESVDRTARVDVMAGDVRAGPGSGHRVVGQVGRDEEVPILSRRGSWLRLAGPGPAWVHESLVTIPDPDDGPGIVGALDEATGEDDR